MDFNDKRHREHWFEVLQVDTMSIEESDKENDEDILVLKPLSWRSSEFEKLLNVIDKEREEIISSKKVTNEESKWSFFGMKSTRQCPKMGLNLTFYLNVKLYRF